MRIVYIFLATFFLSLSAREANAYDQSTKVLFCGSCAIATDFSALAKTASGTVIGSHEFLVANPNTNHVYDVIIEVDYEVELKRYFWIIERNQELSSGEEHTFGVVYPYLAQEKVIYVEAPKGGTALGGTESFVSWDRTDVCNLFTATPDFVALQNEFDGSFETLVDLLEQFVGNGPQGVFVFANGDVARFNIYPNLPGATACGYVKGSARNAVGQFINDRGLGGNGSSDGQQYVRPNPGGFTIYGGGPAYLSCAYIQSADGSRKLIGCIFESP